MSEHGAALQTYNQELVKCLEDLKLKRLAILGVIKNEEEEKMILERNINSLQEQLTKLVNSLQQHRLLYDNYDRTIRDTEIGFKKILESSQALLQLAQHESNSLNSTKEGQLNGNNY